MSSKSESQKSGRKVLRIGLIQNGKILEERLIRTAKPVRVGQDIHKNDLVVPASNLPKSFQLFGIKGNSYVLFFDSKMTGRISMGDGVKTLDEFVRQNKATKTSDGGYQLKLNPRARGKVKLGEVTLLFQFVTPPPPVARPVLPASMRGGWFKGMDYWLVAMIALSAILQIGFVAYLQSQEWPEQIDRLDQRIPDRFVRVMVEEEPEEIEIPDDQKSEDESAEGEGEPEEAADEEPTPAPAEDPKPEPEKKAEEEPAEKSAEEIAAAEEARKKRMEEEVRNTTALNQIGALADGAGGNLADALAGGSGNVSMDEAFEGTSGVKRGTGEEKSGLRTGGGSGADGKGSAAGIEDLGATRGAREAEKGVETGSKAEEEVKAQVKVEDGGDVVGSGTLDASSISSVVKRNQSAIQNCFERVLKQNPSAGGKLVLTATIGGAGRVTSATANTSIGGGMKQCVETAAKGWRFARPKGGDVMFNKTFVLQSSN